MCWDCPTFELIPVNGGDEKSIHPPRSRKPIPSRWQEFFSSSHQEARRSSTVKFKARHRISLRGYVVSAKLSVPEFAPGTVHVDTWGSCSPAYSIGLDQAVRDSAAVRDSDGAGLILRKVDQAGMPTLNPQPSTLNP